MYYNPEYMNPIMKGLNQPAQPQQGIASLSPTPPTQATPPTQGIHNQQFIDPGVGQFNPPSSAFPDPSAPTDQFGNTIGWNPPPINLFPSQPPGYQPPGVQPGVGTFDHLTDNPYAAGPPDDFITIEGVRHYVGGAQQATPPQPPTAPPLTQTAPPQGNLGIFPGGNPGFDESSNNPYGINQGIASLAGTNPGI